MEIKKCEIPTSQEIFEGYKRFVGTFDINSNIITEDRLMAWAKNPSRKFICIFCGNEPTDRNGFVYCQRCKEYKGIMPDC